MRVDEREDARGDGNGSGARAFRRRAHRPGGRAIARGVSPRRGRQLRVRVGAENEIRQRRGQRNRTPRRRRFVRGVVREGRGAGVAERCRRLYALPDAGPPLARAPRRHGDCGSKRATPINRLVLTTRASSALARVRANEVPRERKKESLFLSRNAVSTTEEILGSRPPFRSRAIRLRHVIGGGDFGRFRANETLAASIRRNAQFGNKRRDGGGGVGVNSALKAPTTREHDRHERDVRLKRRRSARSDTHARPRLPARARDARVVDSQALVLRVPTRGRACFPGSGTAREPPCGTRSRSRETGTRARPSLKTLADVD